MKTKIFSSKLFLKTLLFSILTAFLIPFIGMESTLDMISNFLFYYHFIHSHFYLSGQTPAVGVAYSQEQTKHFFLFFRCLLLFVYSFLELHFKNFFCIFIFILLILLF